MLIRGSRILLLLSLPASTNSFRAISRGALLTTTATVALRMSAAAADSASESKSTKKEYYRKDGVRIDHDPYAPGMAAKYGLPGSTDDEGFDPYADTVGPGIYGGSVQRDEKGNLIMGQQYQNHNQRPGPVYDGTGYSLMSRAIQAGPETIQTLLADFPTYDLVGEVSTGGAQPLHVCGMSRNGQLSTQTLIDAGADIHAVDTYGYTALHRMASNNLEVGGEALVKAGMDPNERMEGADSTPVEIAKRSRALKFLMAMQRLGYYD